MPRFAAKLAWCASVIAMITVVCGQVLHSPLHHVLPGGCYSAANVSDANAEQPHDHAGHSHSHQHEGCHQHHTANDTTTADHSHPTSQQPAPCSDHHDCVLCQALSQSLTVTPSVTLVATPEVLEVLSEQGLPAVLESRLAKPFSRGPPAI